MALTDTQKADFYKLLADVESGLTNEFLRDSFSDWVDDLEDTDWEYYDEEEDLWKEDLLKLGYSGILSKLEEYQADWEEVAYEGGYLPQNEGVDVRNYSDNLTEYLR
ncbi:TPA: hypothetical protein ACGWER_002016 [Streptococcus agalactiae]|nr:hypothetical protein [Streptococcus agalactiae]HEO2267352.1 hypothetical protein [Streptococcus agalactiae]HEO7770499.1 hypothetical protein [Streptococcus agalactiae]